MATQADFAVEMSRMSTVITAIAEKLAQAGMPASQEDAVLAQVRDIATALEALAAPTP